MAKNEFLSFGTGAGANVMAQSAYENFADRQRGFQSGIARSEQLNKVWRQTSTMAAVLGQFIADMTGGDVRDDGDITTLVAGLVDAIFKSISAEDVKVQQPFEGAQPTTLDAWLAGQVVNVKTDFKAGGLGLTDDTDALKSALATGKSVYLPAGTYTITETLHFTKDGQILFGDGKDAQSVIRNISNSKPLFTFSSGTGAVYRRRCGIQQVSFVGNSATTEGVALRGIIDDGLTGDADKSCWMRDVRISGVGGGFGLRVSSWSNSFSSVEIWECNKGLQCGSEFNANAFHGLYISGCTNEAIVSVDGPGQQASSTFIGTVAQYSGGTRSTIDLQEAYAFKFVGLYLEGNKAPCNLLFGSRAHSCTATGVIHNLETGTAGIQVIRNEGKGTVINGVTNLGGTVDSLVRIEGMLPTTTVAGLQMSSGAATNGELYDFSARKATVRGDGLESRLGPAVIRALFSENALEVRRSDTDALQMFVQDGKLYFGSDTTVPSLQRSGGTLSMLYGAGTGTFRAPQFGLGATGGPLWMTTPGSPEGAITAPPGSICSRTAGGAGTTLYVKESGTGNTGWVAK